jgi:hypothetical protein
MEGKVWTEEALSIKDDYELHERLITQRTKDFDKQIESVKEGSCVLIMDFKANINLGNGPEMDSTIFFQAPQRTVYAVVGFFSHNGIKYKIIFNVVSPILNHDSTMVHDILSVVLAHKTFDQFQINAISFWMDNAPNQFRTKQFYGTMLEVENMVRRNASVKRQVAVEFNFFVEYHGKSDCDRFFGMLARLYIEETSGQNASDITTTKEFIRMFSDGIHERGGYVIDDQIDFAKLLPIDQEKVNVHTFEFIPSYLTEEQIAAALSNRKTVIPSQITVTKVIAHDVITMVPEVNQAKFAGRVYPQRLPGTFVWGNFYSFKVTSIQDINLFVVQEELEKSFTLDKANIPFLQAKPYSPALGEEHMIGPQNKIVERQVRYEKGKTEKNVEYGANVLQASVHLGDTFDNIQVRVPVYLEPTRVSRAVKIGGNVKVKGYRCNKLHRKSTFLRNHQIR